RRGQLVVPRFTMGIGVDAEGVTRRWATAVGSSEVPLPSTDELFDAVIWQYGTALERAADEEDEQDLDHAGGAAGAITLTRTLSSEQYRDLVARAVTEMQAPDATLRKVVL